MTAVGLGVFLALLASNEALAQPRKLDLKRAFMLQKLDLSQNVLQGLVLERFDLITTNATKLRNLSFSNNWSLTNYAIYTEYTRKFKNDADRLVTAGVSRDLATASDAYHHVIDDCIACHSIFGPGRLPRYQQPIPQTAKK